MKPNKTGFSEEIIMKGYTSETVGVIKDLPTVRGSDGALYSCWKMSWKERFGALFGKPCWIGVLSGVYGVQAEVLQRGMDKN